MLNNHTVVASNAELESPDAKRSANTKLILSGQSKIVSNTESLSPYATPCENTPRSCNGGRGNSKYSGVALSSTADCSDSVNKVKQHANETNVSHGVHVGGILKYLANPKGNHSTLSNHSSDSTSIPNAEMGSPDATPHANSWDFVFTKRRRGERDKDFVFTCGPKVELQSLNATPRTFDDRDSPHIRLAANESSTLPSKIKDPTFNYSMSRTRISSWADHDDSPCSSNSEKGSGKYANEALSSTVATSVGSSYSVHNVNQHVSESGVSHGVHVGATRQYTHSLTGVRSSLIVKNTFVDLADPQSETEVTRRNACARSASADGVLNRYCRGAPIEPHSFFLGFKGTRTSIKSVSSFHTDISNSELQNSDRMPICQSMLTNHDVVASNAELESPDATPRANSTFILSGEKTPISNAEWSSPDTAPCQSTNYCMSRIPISLCVALDDTKTANHQNGITRLTPAQPCPARVRAKSSPAKPGPLSKPISLCLALDDTKTANHQNGSTLLSKPHDVDGGFAPSVDNSRTMPMSMPMPSCVDERQNELQSGPAKPCNAKDHDAGQVKLRLHGLLPSRPGNRSSQTKLDGPTEDATTLVIQGIPQVVCQSTLMSLLDQAGLKFKYDFFLLPSHGTNGVNIGWAIINLVDLQSATLLKCTFDGLPIAPDSSTSVCKVIPAAIQGISSLWKRFRNTAVNVGSDGPMFLNLILPTSGMSTSCPWFGDGKGVGKRKTQGAEHEDTLCSSISLSADRSGEQTEIKHRFCCSLAGWGGTEEEAKNRKRAGHADAMMSDKPLRVELHNFFLNRGQ